MRLGEQLLKLLVVEDLVNVLSFHLLMAGTLHIIVQNPENCWSSSISVQIFGAYLLSWFLWFCPPPFRWSLCLSISTMGCFDPPHTWGWTWGWWSCNIWNWVQLPDFPMFKSPAGPACLKSCCSPGTFWWHYKLLILISTDINWWNQSTSKKSFLLCETLQHLHSDRTILIKPCINVITFEIKKSTFILADGNYKEPTKSCSEICQQQNLSLPVFWRYHSRLNRNFSKDLYTVNMGNQTAHTYVQSFLDFYFMTNEQENILTKEIWIIIEVNLKLHASSDNIARKVFHQS